MVRKYILLVLFLANFCQAFAQKIDSTYIKTHQDQLTFRVYLDYKFLALGYSDNLKHLEDKLIYKPNTTPGIGLGVSWHGLAIESKIIGIPNGNSKYGKTSYFDLQWHWFMQKIQLSFTYQNYKGFYTEDINNDNILIIRPDLKIRQFRAFAQHIYNNKKISYRSAFINDTRQLKSAGSLLFGIGFFTSRILADSTLIIGGKDNRPQDIHNLQFGPNVGYVYNFVIKKNYFITSSFALGAGFSWITKNGEKEFKVHPNIFPRLAGGYHWDRSSISIMFHYSRSYISKLEEAITNLDAINLRLSYSYRVDFQPKSKLLKTVERFLE